MKGCGRWRVWGVVVCLAAGLGNLVLALAATAEEGAGAMQEVLAELPGLLGDDLLADEANWDEDEAVPNYLQGMGLFTVGRVARPVQAPLTAQNPLLSEDMELPGGEPLLDVSFFNWPETGRPGIVSCKVECEADGQRQQLLIETVMAGDRWTTRQLDMSRWAGRRVRLTATADAVDGSDYRVFVSLAGPYVRRSEGDTNLIMVCLDSLRADHMGCYGYQRDTSPFMDRLAGQGVRFARCNSQAPWTRPSLWSVFTGQYASCNCAGRGREDWRCNARARTLARVLADHGYNVAAVTGGGYTSPTWGHAIGFNEYETAEGDGKMPEVYPRVAEWLRAHAGERFFLFFHTFETHYPYTRRAFGDRRETRAVEAVRNYDSGVLSADSYVRMLHELLRELGLLENTILVIFADHGEDFRELYDSPHGPRGKHGQCLLQTVLHVPLIIVGPGVPAGRVVEDRVQLMDLMPTVLELLGVPAPQGIQAASLTGRFRLAPAGHDEAELYSERCAQGPERKALVRGDWKVIWQEEEQPATTDPAWYWHLEPERLYHLPTDPEEATNLLDERPDVAAGLLERLRAVASANERLREEGLDQFILAEPEGSSEEALRQLRQLGYAQ